MSRSKNIARICTLLITVICSLRLYAGQIEDSTAAIPGNNRIFKQIDSTITSRHGNSDKAETALSLFNFFAGSNVMGDENYAVYIGENYFLKGKLEIPNKNSLTLIKFFCEYNRHSLIGMEAPDLTLYDKSLMPVNINGRKSKFKVLYFYDTGCSQCEIQTPLLVRFINESGCKGTDVYAIYTGSDAGKWMEYISEKKFPAPEETPEGDNFNTIRTFHLYDPDMESEFHTLYNVLKTPQLILIDEYGFIAGRNLDVISMVKLIGSKNETEHSISMFIENLFEQVKPRSYEELKYIADGFYRESAEDPFLFREMMMQLFTLLKSENDYGFQLAAEYVTQEYMTGKPMMWSSAMIEELKFEMEMYNRNRLGCVAADLTLRDQKGKTVNISDICKDNMTVVYFNDINCPVCKAVEEDMYRLMQKYPETRFINIYTGTEYEKWKNAVSKAGKKYRNAIFLEDCTQESGMYGVYDLRYVPAIYVMDSKMTVLAKDISTISLDDILQSSAEN